MGGHTVSLSSKFIDSKGPEHGYWNQEIEVPTPEETCNKPLSLKEYINDIKLDTNLIIIVNVNIKKQKIFVMINVITVILAVSI